MWITINGPFWGFEQYDRGVDVACGCTASFCFHISVQRKTCCLSSPPCPPFPPLLSISSGTQCVLWRLPAILIRMSEINIYIKLYICNNITSFLWDLFQCLLVCFLEEYLLWNWTVDDPWWQNHYFSLPMNCHCLGIMTSRQWWKVTSTFTQVKYKLYFNISFFC